MATSNVFFIDVVPEHASWQEWSNALAYVYGSQNLPITDEENWADFANQLQEYPFFCTVDLPADQWYANWQDWATDLIAVANGNINA